MQQHIPIGYGMQDGKICADEERAEVVRRIFADYLSGTPTYIIAKGLMQKGVLNLSGEASWNHGAIGKILNNTKYLGDDCYPQLIEKEVFEQVQIRRKERCHNLGRTKNPNRKQNQGIFSGRLRCGECGEVFHRYVLRRKGSTLSNWKCKNYLHKGLVYCNCGHIYDDQIMEAFVAAANRIIANPRIMRRQLKDAQHWPSPEYRRLDQRIREMEDAGRFTSGELAGLIFQRATVAYQMAVVQDYEHYTEQLQKAFVGRERKDEFDEKLFLETVKQMIIYADGSLKTEFINGLTIEGTYEIRTGR